MGTLIEGLDYELQDVDYEKTNKDLIKETFSHSERYGMNKGLWDYLDICFDDAARHPLSLGVEIVFKAAEMFCEEQGIDDIPPLYQSMFDAGQGFLCQAKMPMYMAQEWTAKFSEPLDNVIDMESDIMKKFVAFLENNKDKQVCKCVLEFLDQK